MICFWFRIQKLIYWNESNHSVFQSIFSVIMLVLLIAAWFFDKSTSSTNVQLIPGSKDPHITASFANPPFLNISNNAWTINTYNLSIITQWSVLLYYACFCMYSTYTVYCMHRVSQMAAILYVHVSACVCVCVFSFMKPSTHTESNLSFQYCTSYTLLCLRHSIML